MIQSLPDPTAWTAQGWRRPAAVSGGLIVSGGRRRSRGFSLVELMIALALSVFLIGGVLIFFASTRASYSDVEQLSRMQESLRFVTDVIVRDARNAAFRDQLGLFGIEFREIAEQYAQITGDGSQLTIQYAGLGSCTEAFDSVRIVRNTYFVEAGNLRCTGVSQRWDPDLSNPAGGSFNIRSQRTESMATGIESIRFRFLGSGGELEQTECGFEDAESLGVACTGVIMLLDFQGLRAEAGGFEERRVELRTSFRNVILQQIFQ